LNAAESEVIRREAERAGFRDTVVVNTCAVTAEAVRQARQTIRALRRERPRAKIVVTGCAAQTQTQMFADMAEVDRVVGNDDKMRADAWRHARAAFDAAGALKIETSDKIAVTDIMSVRQMAPPVLEGLQKGLPRAFVQVQNGCDHRCTFCIIPFGRGNSRSVPMATAVTQVRALVERGHPEIVLTGVDLTSYGGDLEGAPKLGQLVKQILLDVPELKRLRISSVDSIEVDRELLDVIASDERLMPHLHLSLQSGDDLILKRMKRRHSREQAVDFCAEVRRLRPDITLGADIIAGFPTETEDMFIRSLELVEESGLTFLHVFPYSPRPGTPASRMPQVEGGLIKDRGRRLRAAGEAALAKRLETEIGKTREVLIESGTQGRTEHFLPVAISGDMPGTVRRLAIASHDGARLAV
ncbi:MAG: tRNA (N(6)-L-threonylcarbamoyladenosine(37)-C(2))-methylthiotransferase MtaB, partial [Bradyrhizobium sp.]